MKVIIGTHPIRLKDMRYAILHSAVIQAVLLLLTSSILDGGGVFSVFLVAVTAHWIVFAMIVLQRRHNLTRADSVLIKWGFAIYLLLLPILGWTIHAFDMVTQR